MAKSDEHSTPGRRAQVRELPGEILSCTLTAPGACKIRHGRNILQVPFQIIPLLVAKRNSHPLRGESKL